MNIILHSRKFGVSTVFIHNHQNFFLSYMYTHDNLILNRQIQYFRLYSIYNCSVACIEVFKVHAKNQEGLADFHDVIYDGAHWIIAFVCTHTL